MLSDINIHTFGDGKGEAIAIIFPQGKIGIIDFGSSVFFDWIKNYLIENSIKEIEFLLWTHPHYDHSSYLEKLLDFLKEKEIIVHNFFAFNYQHIMDIADITKFFDDKICCAISSPTSFEIFRRPNILTKICDKICSLQHSIIQNFQYLSMGQVLYEAETFNNIKIVCLSPTPTSSCKYHKFIKSFYSEDNLITIESKNHNLISVAILINFNENILIFGGDTENETWQEYFELEKERFQYLSNDIKFLKAPHHGSSTSFNEKLWKNWGKDYCVVVTPLSKNHLPDKEILIDIKDIPSNVFVLREARTSKTKNILSIFQDAISDVTDSIKETHHFCFTIDKEGNTETKWL